MEIRKSFKRHPSNPSNPSNPFKNPSSQKSKVNNKSKMSSRIVKSIESEVNKILPEYLFRFILHNYEEGCKGEDGEPFARPSDEEIKAKIGEYHRGVPFVFEEVKSNEKKRMGRPPKNQKETIVAEDGLEAVIQVSNIDTEPSNVVQSVGEEPAPKAKKVSKEEKEKEAQAKKFQREVELQAKKEAKEKEAQEKKEAKEKEAQEKKEAKEKEAQAKKDAKKAEKVPKEKVVKEKVVKEKVPKEKKEKAPKEKKEKVVKEEGEGEVKKRGRPKKSEVATTASQQEIEEVKAVMKIAIQSANEALEGTGVQMKEPKEKKDKKSKKSVEKAAVQEAEMDKITDNKTGLEYFIDKTMKVERKDKEDEWYVIKDITTKDVVGRSNLIEVELFQVLYSSEQQPSSPVKVEPSSSPRSEVDFGGEEEEEEYEGFEEFVASPTTSATTSPRKAVEENVKKFTHEGVDYYVDKNITMSSEEDEEGVTWHPIKVSSSHKIVGRSSGKSMEFYVDSDDEEEEEEEEEDDDEDDDEEEED